MWHKLVQAHRNLSCRHRGSCLYVVSRVPNLLESLLINLYLGSSVGSLMWSCIEANVAIVSACIPSMAPLLLIALGKKPQGVGRYRSSIKMTGMTNKTSNIHTTKDYFGSQPQSQSLEFIVNAHRSEADDAQSSRPTIPVPSPAILVTHQIDQTSGFRA